MMNINKLLILFLLSTTSAISAAEGRRGGGSFQPLMESQSLLKINKFYVEKNEEKLIRGAEALRLLEEGLSRLKDRQITRVKGFTLQKFEETKNDLLILFTQDDLKILDQVVDAINYPDRKIILINIKAWDKADKGSKLHLLVHEILGVMEIEDANYAVSTEVMSYIGIPSLMLKPETPKTRLYVKLFGNKIPKKVMEEVISDLKVSVDRCATEIPKSNDKYIVENLKRIEELQVKGVFTEEEGNQARVGLEISMALTQEICRSTSKQFELVSKAKDSPNVFGRYDLQKYFNEFRQMHNNIRIFSELLQNYSPRIQHSKYDGGSYGYFSDTINKLSELSLMGTYMLILLGY